MRRPELLSLGPSGCSPRAKERRKGAGVELNQWYDHMAISKHIETWTPGNYQVNIILQTLQYFFHFMFGLLLGGVSINGSRWLEVRWFKWGQWIKIEIKIEYSHNWCAFYGKNEPGKFVVGLMSQTTMNKKDIGVETCGLMAELHQHLKQTTAIQKEWISDWTIRKYQLKLSKNWP